MVDSEWCVLCAMWPHVRIGDDTHHLLRRLTMGIFPTATTATCYNA